LASVGQDSCGADVTYAQAGALNTFQFADAPSDIHGNHSPDFGGDVRPIKRENVVEDIDARGSCGFNGVVTGSSVLAGLPCGGQAALFAACPPACRSFGDDWPRFW
jgi:hypothetical protein